jgi:hypothetical protein
LKLPSKAKTTSSPSAITLVASAAAAQVPGERAQVELLARLDRGGYVDPTKVTLAAYLDRWLGHMASIGRDERTVERYGELLRLHVTPHLGGLRLQQLAPMHLSDLYAKLLREGDAMAAQVGCPPVASCTSTGRCTGRCGKPSGGGCWPSTRPPTSNCRRSQPRRW